MNTQDNFGLRRVLVFVCLILTVVVLPLPYNAVEATFYQEHNLVSDLTGVADFTDTNLVNPWGIASSSTSPFWVSDNKTGLSTLYNGLGQPINLVVTIPPAAGENPPSAPTGVVFNANTTEFDGAHFIFATENGTISSWTSGTFAVLRRDNFSSGAIYKGLAISTNASGNNLYAANFFAGRIDVFDNTYTQITLGAGSFTDPNLPSGYAPFNIQNIGGKLYVTYAVQDADKHDDVAAPGNGIVDVYDTNGNLLQRLISNGGPLDSPWGMAIAPAGFGEYSNDLLIGNFGDGKINAFDPNNGNVIGTLSDGMGNPIVIDGLWGLRFGNGGNGVLNFDNTNILYFTAGIPGPDGGMVEDHGLFGSISVLAVPEPSTFLLLGAGLAGVGLLRRRVKK